MLSKHDNASAITLFLPDMRKIEVEHSLIKRICRACLEVVLSCSFLNASCM